ncbi:hypothetical protein NC651_018321 [Populus alba x Populus x berolinensis]|nr:hypothetical protein NC651_018321 [Populus alba x Populus x berolinensis]
MGRPGGGSVRFLWTVWPSLLMAEKGVDGSTGREANSWGAAEREAGDQAGGEERFGFVGEGRGKSGQPVGLSGWPSQTSRQA